MAKKKSYNPFKMWGAWVGAIIFLYVLGGFSLRNCTIFEYCYLNQLFIYIMRGGLSLLILFVISIIGFLIGWGIHSLVRRFRK